MLFMFLRVQKGGGQPTLCGQQGAVIEMNNIGAQQRQNQDFGRKSNLYGKHRIDDENRLGEGFLLDLVGSNVFKVETRLLMSYYPGRLGGLSDLAFKSYILKCRAVRERRRGPGKPPSNVVWNGFNEMKRAGGGTAGEKDAYKAAIQKLREKYFIRSRPKFETWQRTEVNEVLILPDYMGGKYIPWYKPQRNARELEKLKRGYIMVPRDLGQDFFHRNPASAWATLIKLYQFNHLVAFGGVDANIIRHEGGALWFHPCLFEELGICEEEFKENLRIIEEAGMFEFVPISYRKVDAIGTEQIVYQGDGRSDISVIRLKYQPVKQLSDWRKQIKH